MFPNTNFSAIGQCYYENAPPNTYGRYNVYGNIQPTSIYGNPHIHQTSSQSPPATPPLTDNGLYSPATTIATDNRNYSRTVYSREQVAELETEYRGCKFVKGARGRQIAERIGVDESKVKVWFKNRRAKDKKRSAITPSNSEENRLSSVAEILNSSNNPNEEASSTSQNSLKRMSSDDIDDLLQVFEDYIREKSELLQPPLKKPKVEILEHMIFNPTTNCWVRYDSLCPM
ncbi:homeobox protein engrailed-like ceh-16 [Bactrocera dorsalis]|uniref:Homeobox protein engrailed-like ceh-16 n=1 Tax=Bactrocera dorsalis TaxID=27457 RepID=A0ABM3JMQ3_BACDO|nr:homeobox protein engrailed-like ceh-16 [Bactrocera dorsalis]